MDGLALYADSALGDNCFNGDIFVASNPVTVLIRFYNKRAAKGEGVVDDHDSGLRYRQPGLDC